MCFFLRFSIEDMKIQKQSNYEFGQIIGEGRVRTVYLTKEEQGNRSVVKQSDKKHQYKRKNDNKKNDL